MNIGKWIEHLLNGVDPLEQYLLALLKAAIATATPQPGQDVEIGKEPVRFLGEKWVVKLIATREA